MVELCLAWKWPHIRSKNIGKWTESFIQRRLSWRRWLRPPPRTPCTRRSFSTIHTTIKGSCKKSYFLLVARPLKNNQLKVQTIDVVVKNYTFFNGLIKVAKSTHSKVLIHSFLFIEGLKYHLQFYACHGCELYIFLDLLLL